MQDIPEGIIGKMPIKHPPKKRKKKRGEEVRYSAELTELICNEIAAGSTLSRLQNRPGFPSASAVRFWIVDNKEFAAKYARAREARSEARSDRIDKYKMMALRGEIPPDVARVAIDAEKWQAGKENPKRYGDKQQIDHSGTVTLAALVEESYKIAREEPKLIEGERE